ncbi:hypothetical protein BGZ82_003435, partial [Podila clonocystis]
EEQTPYLEACRIEQNEKRITMEREDLLRLLNTTDVYGLGGPASAGASPGSNGASSLSSLGGDGSGFGIKREGTADVWAGLQ